MKNPDKYEILERAHEAAGVHMMQKSPLADELIACLEGEIAKRDARIVELESRYQRDVYGLNNEGDPIGGDPSGGYANDNARLRAELASIKAQGVVMPEREEFEDVYSAEYGTPVSVLKLLREGENYIEKPQHSDRLNSSWWMWQKACARLNAAKAIIDGLRGEVADLRTMLATVSKAGLRVRTERDQQAKRIGELEGMLREVRLPDDIGRMDIWTRIDAALSAGKDAAP